MFTYHPSNMSSSLWVLLGWQRVTSLMMEELKTPVCAQNPISRAQCHWSSEKSNKSRSEIPLHSHQKAKTKTTENTTCWHKHGASRTLTHRSWEQRLTQPLWKSGHVYRIGIYPYSTSQQFRSLL